VAMVQFGDDRTEGAGVVALAVDRPGRRTR